MSEEGWKISISVKIGDHMATVHGDTAAEAFQHLTEIAEHVAQVHQALSILDGGRPATEIVQKEKQWGARSQGGRSYQSTPGNQAAPAASAPTSAPSFPAPPASPAPTGWNPALAGTPQPGPQFDPQQALQQQLGAVQLSQTPNQETPNCPIHQQPLKYFGPGKNANTGKQYGASWRCGQRGCSGTKWQNLDGTWS